MEDPRLTKFLHLERCNRQKITVRRIFLEMTGDLRMGLMLSRLVYFFLPDEFGNSKGFVSHVKGTDVCVRTLADWKRELHMNEVDVDYASEGLKGMGFINFQAVSGNYSYSMNWENIRSEYGLCLLPKAVSKDKSKSDDFDKFWDLYSYKVGRFKCEQKWNKLKPADKVAIFQTLPAYIKSSTIDRKEANEKNKVIRCHPMTYLNQKRWLDEMEYQKDTKKSSYFDQKVKNA